MADRLWSRCCPSRMNYKLARAVQKGLFETRKRARTILRNPRRIERGYKVRARNSALSTWVSDRNDFIGRTDDTMGVAARVLNQIG